MQQEGLSCPDPKGPPSRREMRSHLHVSPRYRRHLFAARRPEWSAPAASIAVLADACVAPFEHDRTGRPRRRPDLPAVTGRSAAHRVCSGRPFGNRALLAKNPVSSGLLLSLSMCLHCRVYDTAGELYRAGSNFGISIGPVRTVIKWGAFT